VGQTKSIALGCASGLLALLLSAGSAAAVTFTYVNSGPADSRVYVGFFNNASGNTTSDLVSDPAAYSRNDTLLGPLVPPFDALAYSGAELGTNLDNLTGSSPRSVFSPFNPTFFRAHGQAIASTGSYSANAFAFSGDTTATSPGAWTVHVDPSGAEVAGTPATVTVDASIAGFVSVAGASVADAAWSVTTSAGSVMSGTANQSVAGTTNFSDLGTISFSVPLGGTFDLTVDYDLSTSGGGVGADSTSQVDASLVEISAFVPPMLAPISGSKLLMIDKYANSGKAKIVLLAKDTTPGSISKGPSADPTGLTGTIVLFQEANPSNRAVFDLAGSGWSKNKVSIAKYKNTAAAPGTAGAKIASVKPDKLVKLVASNLGDGDAASGDQDTNDLDLSVLTTSDVIKAVITIYNANDGSQHTMCAQFESPTIKPIGGGTGTKYLSKMSSLPSTCPVCNNGIAEPGEECTAP